MITIDWTYSSIKTAAEVIFTINPNQHKSPQEVESYIKRQSEEYVDYGRGVDVRLNGVRHHLAAAVKRLENQQSL